MSLLIPPSVKLCVACCHIDFRTSGVSVIPDEGFARKLECIARIFDSAPAGPQLIVFPEGADCDLTRDYARRWARKFSAVTICGTSRVGDKVKGTVVVPEASTVDGYREEIFEKQHLSPNDALLAGHPLTAGSSGGIIVRIPCQTASGAPFEISALVLICYDFRFLHHRAKDFNDIQVVVVPMFDESTAEPESIGRNLAKRHYTRVFLVNKASRLAASIGRGAPWRMKVGVRLTNAPRPLHAIAEWLTRLPSSAYGPLASRFAEHLKKCGAKDVDPTLARLWRYRGEAVTIGLYEVAQAIALGHDTAYGAGYFYSELRHERVAT